MLMNCDTANKRVKQLALERNKLLAQEREASTYSYLHGEEPYVPEYDFAATQKKLDELAVETATIKHAVNVFNSTTVSPITGLTVDAMLVRMPMLSAQKEKLGRMRSAMEKTRRMAMNAKASEYTVRNYSAEEAEAEYQRVTDELTILQQELNRINLTEQFEVDI